VQGFFERDGVKWIDNVRQSYLFDSRSIRADANACVSRRNALGRNQNSHIIVGHPVSLHVLELVINFIRRNLGSDSRQQKQAIKGASFVELLDLVSSIPRKSVSSTSSRLPICLMPLRADCLAHRSYA